MIKITAIFGQNAVTEYENTGLVPSQEQEFPDGSQILQKEFATIEERDAYVEALDESDGTDNWRVIQHQISDKTKLQFRNTGNPQWRDFPPFPTVEEFNNDFPAEFMHSYYNSNNIAWEQDMYMWVNDESTQEEFQSKGHDIPTKWKAEEEMKRLRQIILNETMEDFFADLVSGKIEFRRIPV